MWELLLITPEGVYAMSLKGFRRNFRPLEILTTEQVEDVKRGVLAVLQNTGMRFESKMALELFRKNDCPVDSDKMRVCFNKM